MIEEFTTKNMSDLLYDDLSKIKDDNENNTQVIFYKPNIESTFPCRVINTPLDKVLKAENGTPILKEYEITIEHWSDNQDKCMEMISITDKILQKRNMLRTKTQSVLYDEALKKYNLTVIYGVCWEGLTNSFIYKK